ncbi:hypothetical protein [Streptomyces sp. CA-251247]|uniref:hypothetical protein n=1 Tax=Streptomyces sp. CA-251247 TaxID=3240062 RepID=UPI003D8C02C6
MTAQPPSLPACQSALDHQPTVVGHRNLVAKRWAWLTLVICLMAFSVYAGVGQSLRKLVGLALVSLCLYPLLVWVTALALHRTRRVATILETYPWRAYPCEYPRRTGESPKVIMIRFSDDHAPVLRFTPFSVNLAQKQNPQPDTIWFAGDPRFGGVVSPVGGHFPVRVVPEAPAGHIPDGSPEDDALAERAGLITGGKVHTT